MLDLARVSQQIAHMASESQLVAEDLSKRLNLARQQLHSQSENLDALVHKLTISKTSWLLAGIDESLEATYALPDRPQTVTVVASDGSQITPSHHEIVPAYLINIATVVLHYGTGERAEFNNTPTLFYREQDLYTACGGQQIT